MQIRMQQLFKEKYFVFNKFQLVLLCRIIPKMKTKYVSKYVVCFSNKNTLKVMILQLFFHRSQYRVNILFFVLKMIQQALALLTNIK